MYYTLRGGSLLAFRFVCIYITFGMKVPCVACAKKGYGRGESGAREAWKARGAHARVSRTVSACVERPSFTSITEVV